MRVGVDIDGETIHLDRFNDRRATEFKPGDAIDISFGVADIVALSAR